MADWEIIITSLKASMNKLLTKGEKLIVCNKLKKQNLLYSFLFSPCDQHLQLVGRDSNHAGDHHWLQLVVWSTIDVYWFYWSAGMPLQNLGGRQSDHQVAVVLDLVCARLGCALNFAPNDVRICKTTNWIKLLWKYKKEDSTNYKILK